MRYFALPTCWLALGLLTAAGSPVGPVPLFDGRSFQGWEGDTNQTWRVESGALVGGSTARKVERNEFLCTVRPFTNFVLRLQFRLTGSDGFVNAGVQVRSERLTDPPNEMRGYQADIGEGYWGALYDESRRNRILVAPAKAEVERAVKPGEWNDYVIRCEGPRIRIWLNGAPMIDYTEPEPGIPLQGRIGLQIHGGARAQVEYRAITIEEL